MISIEIDKNSLDKVKNIVSKLDPNNADSVIKRSIIKAANFVLDLLHWNVTGPILKVRTGNLARSLGMRVEKVGKDWVGFVGSGALVINPQQTQGVNESIDRTFRMVYADILETGGTIRPINGQFLAIPIGDALTPAGVARFSAAQLRDGKTNYEGSVIIDGIIFGLSQTKTRSKMTPLFVLKRSVEIPAKKYLSQTALEANTRVGQIFVDELEKGLKQ